MTFRCWRLFDASNQTTSGRDKCGRALHRHMPGETPRIPFLHYEGSGKAVDPAKAVKTAPDAQSAVGR
ncbi:DUF1259 domain-containing protein [Burkholderia sp. Tr-862]|uniref:DUF1259 domain-containing protein n=1 Tax=Burkholderia sp. Tr-862 TaxID=2608331 RepID=UPI00141A0E64|nr:DUF1259 domain-containing protein [Burkholderia sp. Tr-862]NIF40388.1 DUF1259 domain-containing protein [Burkholderia sp. Tr-862]